MNIGTVVDIVLIATIIGIVGFYAIRGFVWALKPFRKWAAIALAWCLKSPVATLLGKFMPFESWRNTMEENSYAAWSAEITKAVDSVNSESVSEETFDGVGGLFGFFDSLFGELKAKCVEAVKEGALDVADSVSKFFADTAISVISQTIAFVILFIALMLIFVLVTILIEQVCEDSIIGTLNHVLGGTMGLIVAFVAVWIVSLVIVGILPFMVENGGGFTRWMHDKFLLSQMFGIKPKI